MLAPAPRSLVALDVAGDGGPDDLVVANFGYFGYKRGSLTFLMNGVGSLLPPEPHNTVELDWAPRFVAAAPLRSDGRTALLVLDYFDGGKLHVFPTPDPSSLANGDAYALTTGDECRVIVPEAPNQEPQVVKNIAVGCLGRDDFGKIYDFTREDDTERFGATNRRTIEVREPAGPDVALHGLAMADMNGDGHADFIVADEQGTVVFELSDATGTSWTRSQVSNVGKEPRGIATGDFNGDGLLDVVVTNFADENDRVVVLINEQNGSIFHRIRLLSNFPRPQGILAADLNGDGRTDIAYVAGEPREPGRAVVRLNAGTWEVPAAP